MNPPLLDHLIKQLDLLSPEQQLQLIAHMAGNLSKVYPQHKPARKWREVCGAVAYPCLGEDAQEWITKSREEDDTHRPHSKG